MSEGTDRSPASATSFESSTERSNINWLSANRSSVRLIAGIELLVCKLAIPRVTEFSCITEGCNLRNFPFCVANPTIIAAVHTFNIDDPLHIEAFNGLPPGHGACQRHEQPEVPSGADPHSTIRHFQQENIARPMRCLQPRFSANTSHTSHEDIWAGCFRTPRTSSPALEFLASADRESTTLPP